jgi:hypothetical protein
VILSLVMSCRELRIDPFAYFRDVIHRPSRLGALGESYRRAGASLLDASSASAGGGVVGARPVSRLGALTRRRRRRGRSCPNAYASLRSAGRTIDRIASVRWVRLAESYRGIDAPRFEFPRPPPTAVG